MWRGGNGRDVHRLLSAWNVILCNVKKKGHFGHACAQFFSLTYFHDTLLNDPSHLSLDSHWLTELLSGTLGLTMCVCQCSCVCMACISPILSPAALLFAPVFLFAPLPLSDPVPLFLPQSKSRLPYRRLSLPLLRKSRPLFLTRHLSAPPSISRPACGVNCHKACRGRLAVECRKRTKSISHETPPTLQARSYSFPPPANTPPSLQNTGEGSCS